MEIPTGDPLHNEVGSGIVAATIEHLDAIEAAAALNVELLYPMSGLETEEPILQPGRIDVLLGQGQTASVLRNLCLLVHQRAPEDWQTISRYMRRLFGVALQEPSQTVRGSIELHYQQTGVREPLDVAMAGRGFQQMLLIVAYLYSHKNSVLLIDEPDAHLLGERHGDEVGEPDAEHIAARDRRDVEQHDRLAREVMPAFKKG